MPDKKEHGSIYCGPRGWYSMSSDEYILNELPALPGEPKTDSKKDPDVFNLMPVCRTIRCDIPPPPFWVYFIDFWKKNGIDELIKKLNLNKVDTHTKAKCRVLGMRQFRDVELLAIPIQMRIALPARLQEHGPVTVTLWRRWQGKGLRATSLC